MFRSQAPRTAAADPVAPSQTSSISSDVAGPSKTNDAAASGSSSASEAQLESTTDSMWRKMVADNPYFGAGAGLMAIGVALTAFRRATTLGASFAQRRMLVTLEIPSKDRSYPWFLEWMAHQTPSPVPSPSHSNSGISSLWKGKSPMSLRSHELAVETTYKQHTNGSSEAVFNLVPGPGTHYFRYRGSWFQVKRERDAKLMDLHSGSPWETLTLTTLSSSRHLFAKLLADARRLAEKSTEGKTVVYTAWGVEWRPFGKPRRRREMGSVVLEQGVAERVVDDLRGFLGRGKWYAERGIPYRRGYLLHGPPGSGKTSFIQALAGELGYNICLLNLAERGLTDDKLNHLLGLVPERSFVLLEDVDSAFSKRDQTGEEGIITESEREICYGSSINNLVTAIYTKGVLNLSFKSSVTFSGLLNALDGVASSEERVIFMTTNHYERLDPALIRPGRVDVDELLGDAAGEQAQRLFVKFYGRGVVDPAQRAVERNAPIGQREKVASQSLQEDGEAEGVRPAVQRVLRRNAELEEEEVERLSDEVRAILESAQQRGNKGVSMAALQGLFIRHGPREAVEALKELV